MTSFNGTARIGGEVYCDGHGFVLSHAAANMITYISLKCIVFWFSCTFTESLWPCG